MDLHQYPHLSVPHILELHTCWAPEEMKYTGRRFTCYPKHGPISIPPCLLGTFLKPVSEKVRDSPLTANCPFGTLLAGMRECGSNSLFHLISFNDMLYRYLFFFSTVQYNFNFKQNLTTESYEEYLKHEIKFRI